MADYVVGAEEFYKGGLPDEGPYGFVVEKIAVVEREIKKQSSPRYGQTFTQLEAQMRLVEDPEGPIDNGELVFDSFATGGRGAKRTASFYKALTGRELRGTIDDETGELVINFSAVADELQGLQGYGYLRHQPRREQQPDGSYVDTEIVDAKFGWGFANNLRGVKAPKK